MSAAPLFSAAITPAASGAGMTFEPTPSFRASSATRSGTGPVAVPERESTRACTGLVPRNTARSVPVGASVAAGDWAAAGNAIKPMNTAMGRRMVLPLLFEHRLVALAHHLADGRPGTQRLGHRSLACRDRFRGLEHSVDLGRRHEHHAAPVGDDQVSR